MKFKLSDNITLNGDWIPIGNNYCYFKGEFDGGGKTISGLTINSTADYQGLFGYVNGATISHINLDSVDISGSNYVGAVVGYAENNSNISNCTVTGTISGNENVGAVVGGSYKGFTISDCTATGDISGNNCVGGIAGYISRLEGNSTVSNCVTTGSVSGNEYVGAVVGYNSGTVSDNKVDCTVSGDEYVGAVAGFNSGGTVSGNYYHSDKEAVGYNNEVGSVSNNTKVYQVTLNGVTASGAITIGNNTFAPENSELTVKNGYILSGGTTVTEGKTFTATLDENKRYVFGDATNGYTLATGTNVATNNYPDLTEVFTLTAPTGYTVSDVSCSDANKLISIKGENYYLRGAKVSFGVTSTAQPRRVIDTVNNTQATNGKFSATINADTNLTKSAA